MKVDGKSVQSLWWCDSPSAHLRVIDQRWLPHEFRIEEIHSVEHAATAIAEMHVRGAPLIGATAAYGMSLAALEALSRTSRDASGEPSGFDERIRRAADLLKSARPTAVNLAWAVDRVTSAMENARAPEEKAAAARQIADAIASDEVERSRQIGQYGAALIREAALRKRGQAVNILTHCNAGWLCTVDYGTATAPIYAAFDEGLPVHVWVDETRPRNQGARLTAWELGKHGVPHTVVTDNAGGHLMQRGLVDLVIVGTDRTTYTGDVINKIGTYQKALAAKDNRVPFYVAAPSSSIDWHTPDGTRVEIEERDEEEVLFVQGLLRREGGGAPETVKVQLAPQGSPASNYAFDVTPARLVTGLITERGICKASEEGVRSLFEKLSQ